VSGSSPFDGAGALRREYLAVDWAATALGDPAGWSSSLRRTLELALGTRFAVLLAWGPEHVMLYNEAYAPILAEKAPALGRRVEDVFPEAWDALGPMFADVLAGRGATWSEDQRLLLDRRGFAEETFFTFSYSPVPTTTAVSVSSWTSSPRRPARSSTAAGSSCWPGWVSSRATSRTRPTCPRAPSRSS